MKRRVVVLVAVVLVTLGVAVAVWAAGGTSESGSRPTRDDCEKTITVQDTGSPKMMEYHRRDCDEDFAVTRSRDGGG